LIHSWQAPYSKYNILSILFTIFMMEYSCNCWARDFAMDLPLFFAILRFS
jgi:hypothetical protein